MRGAAYERGREGVSVRHLSQGAPAARGCSVEVYMMEETLSGGAPAARGCCPYKREGEGPAF